MTDKKCKMAERLDNLEELVKYIVQAVDRIGGMVQILEGRTHDINKELPRPRRVADTPGTPIAYKAG